MEIRSLTKNSENKYPKKKDINLLELKSSIPNIWKKLGITAAVISMITENKVLAVEPEIPIVPLAGGLPYYQPNTIILGVSTTLFWITFFYSIISAIYLICLRKRDDNNLKMKKFFKIFLLVSILIASVAFAITFYYSYTF